MLDVAAAYEAHSAELINYVRRRVGNQEDAEDIVATAFTDVLKDADRYEERGMLRAWLYRITSMRIVDYRRKPANRPTLPLYENSAVAEDAYAPVEARVCCEQLMDRAGLLPNQRRAIYYRYIKEQMPQETADQLNMPVTILKAQQQRGIRRLSKAFTAPSHLKSASAIPLASDPAGALFRWYDEDRAALVERCLKLEAEVVQLRAVVQALD